MLSNNHQYFVYILQCNNGSYYVGVTNDLDRRLYEHENGLNNKAFTYNKRPLKLVFCERFNDVIQAIAFEKQIKGLAKREKRGTDKRPLAFIT